MQITEKLKIPTLEFFLISTIISALIIFIFIIGLKFYNFANFLTYDSIYYFKMSSNPLETTVAPYTYRILTPLLAYSLPFNKIINFEIINLAALISTSVLFYYYLKKLEFKPLYSFIGVLLFILGPCVIYCIYNIALVDPLSFLFFLLAFYAILCKNDKLYWIALILGILNKETILFTIPLYFLYKLEGERQINALKSTLIVLIPVLVILFSIRYYFGFQNYLSVNIIKQTIIYQITSKNIETNPFLTFGILWIIGLYNITINQNKFLKNSLYVLPFIFLQILIATDALRSLFLAFPIIIPFSLFIFKIKDKKIILFFLLLSMITLSSYLTVLICFMNGINNIIGFLLLPLATFVTILLMIILIKNHD